MARSKAMAQMLEDIRLETELTQSFTGYRQFSAAVMEAMASVPREKFVPEEMQPFAYANGPLTIGYGQTISQPYIVALMTELLAVGPGDTVLEIGTGSGYQSAVLSRLVRQVYSMEVVEPLQITAKERLQRLGYGNVEVRQGDGYDGLPDFAPYDGIIVTAAAPQIPPALIEQLKPSARLVIPLGRPYDVQELAVVTRGQGGEVEKRHILDVAFVPLTRQR